MRWCCSGSDSPDSASCSSAGASSDDDADKALANGGRQKGQKKGARVQLRQLGTQLGTKASGGTGRRQPEGILKGTHQRSGRPPRAVQLQYADGQQSGENNTVGGAGPEECRAMLADSPSCSSPSPPCSPRLADQYGPMLLKPCKRALLVLPSSAPFFAPCAQPSTSFPFADCPFISALRQNKWEVQACHSRSASEEMRQRRPVLVLLDASSKAEWAEALRALRAENGDAEQDEEALFALLLDRLPNDRRLRQMTKLRVQQFFLRSSTDISLCEHFSRLCSRLRAVPALFAVVEEAQQPIKICDERNIVQYVNRAYEVQTGRSRGLVLGSDGAVEPGAGRNSRAMNHVAAAAIAASATAAAAASVTWSAATSPPPTITTSSFDDIVAGREKAHGGEARLAVDGAQPESPLLVGQKTPPSPTGIVGRRRSSDWQCIAVPTSSNSQQFVYVKRGSADATLFKSRSSGGVQQLVDAPITEALSALNNIVHRCDEETQAQLREAMRILSSHHELYTPTITRFRDNDRIASGYYDGLIRLHHPNRQRKRSVVDAFRDHQQRRVSQGSNVSGIMGMVGGGPGAGAGEGNTLAGLGMRRRVSTEIISVLEREASWDFDVIELERVTDHHPLSSLGTKIFERWSVAEALQCAPDVLAKWLAVIEANYQSGNAYHNATHAADVLQATSYFLNSDPVGQLIQDQHAPAALIAATVHDLDHPGRGNAFLMNTRQRLAVLYNDQSILENHHVALAFQLTLAQPGVNIFAKLPREEFNQMRQAVIDMVLATDMSKHFEHLAKFQQLMAIMPDADEDRDTNSLIICRMMVKCADIANPTRDWRLCHQWAMRIVEEYFDQTAEEVERKLPVTMKGFDRETCNIPLTQCTFVDMFARETFALWCEFAELSHLLTQLEANYTRWKAKSADWEPKKNNSNLLNRTR